MIGSLLGQGGIMVSGGDNNPYIDMQRASAGMVRYSGQQLEVYDGMNWVCIGSHTVVQLEHDTLTTLAWAKEKMQAEKQLVQRMEKYPGLKDAYEKFKIMDVLTLEHQTEENK